MKTLYFNSISILFFLGFLFISEGIFSQETYITINGVLKDSKSGDRVAFAAITVPGTGIGTVSNSDGEFTLKVNSSVTSEYFEVSHISYATAQFKIAATEGKEQVFNLDVRPVQLGEVKVVPADPRSLVEMALRKTASNYSGDPVMMTGFYRESIMQNRDYISISEAVVDIYKASYVTVQKDQVRIFKGRKGDNVKKADTLLVQLQGGPQVLLMLDVVKNPDMSIAFDNLDNYYFEMEMVVNIDDEPNWVIGFSPALVYDYPLYFGKLYISQVDMAITRAEFNLDLRDPDKAAANFVQKKPIGLLFMPLSTSYLVTFKEDEGKYYLNYSRVELKFRCDWKRKLFKKNYTLVSEMAITGRSSENVARFSNQETFKRTMIFTSEVKDFSDPDFWGENNIIEPEKSIQEAIRKIARKMD